MVVNLMCNYIPDKVMQLHPTDCLRCGLPKAYHSRTPGSNFIPCIRKKPYKLRDHKDVTIGMQVWYVHPYDCEKIFTGMVRIISPGGYISLWKYKQDRDPSRIFDLSYNGSFDASYSCFSSLENALAFQKKCLAKKHI